MRRTLADTFLHLLAVAVLMAAGTAAAKAQVVITQVEDATLYEGTGVAECPSDESNGGGQYLFSGVTDSLVSFKERRALLRFDVSTIPTGSIVRSATVTLNLSRSAPGGPAAESFGLHRVTSSWGEGTTNASGPEGDGAQASPGDATWCERSYQATAWATPGGDFVVAPSAVLPVGSAPPAALHTWGSTSRMVADVQAWVNGTAANNGWILVDEGPVVGLPAAGGPEGDSPTARRFSSSEATNAALRPQLVVTFGEPIPTASPWALAALAGLLGGLGLLALARRR